MDIHCVAETLKAARDRFADHHDNAYLDAQVLLAHVLKCDRAWLIAHARDTLNDSQQAHFQALVERRSAGEPVAYLTGHREFWSLDLQVSCDVLIPRPETELLVEAVLEHVRRTDSKTMTCADLGTGSGAIALALASELPDMQIVATETSLPALKLARTNARRQRLNNLYFSASNWCTALATGGFNIICANPPYIADTDPHLNHGDVRFEPRSALAAGDNGLRDLTRIIDQARRCLTGNGYLFLEHGANQGEQVRRLFAGQGYLNIHSMLDLAGHERVTLACYPCAATL